MYGGSKENRVRLFTVVSSEWRRDNKHGFKNWKAYLNTRGGKKEKKKKKQQHIFPL